MFVKLDRCGFLLGSHFIKKFNIISEVIKGVCVLNVFLSILPEKQLLPIQGPPRIVALTRHRNTKSNRLRTKDQNAAEMCPQVYLLFCKCLFSLNNKVKHKIRP